MSHCYIEFVPKDEKSLRRTSELFAMLKVAKDADEALDDSRFVDYFTETERAYFWSPSTEEQREWNNEWFSTPIEIRHSPKMLTPQWHLESMLDAFSNGDYQLIAIQDKNGKYQLAFNPHGYPYGGTGCMVAFLECFGHSIVGIEDGTGYEKYTPQTKFWKSKQKNRWQFWR
ncbi:hypothetical protein [Undibacterium terreum]|uniref:Uncharacterized protein n=1 Tax=Undibacterium terreum TaxID=1224302 RepID=A0A916U8W3_9BURK|nr:hypothetical protein [Undibacterium terreum]GGC64143.1 hypothetical protein GCM10011396_08880 [Undibacterium terreum]